MSIEQTLQDLFLDTLRKNKIPVSLFLINGIKLQGFIEAFDSYSIVLKNNSSQMVFKHAISTIMPAHTINLNINVPGANPSVSNDQEVSMGQN